MQLQCTRINQYIVLVLIAHLAGCAAEDKPTCPALPGTPEEIAATPRADENLELLARKLSAGITADQAIYDRLVRDVAAIRDMEPRTREIKYETPDSGTQLTLFFDDQAFTRFEAREYDNWDCLNQHYKMILINQIDRSDKRANIHFRGRYDLVKLSKVYASVPGIRLAEPYPFIMSSDRNIGVTAKKEAWHYIFVISMSSDQEIFHFNTRDGAEPIYENKYLGPTVSIHNAPLWIRRYWFGPETMRAFGQEVDFPET